MAKRMTLDEFVAKANAVHSNRYNYSKSVYVNGTTKIIIICPEHGEFEQRPYMHLQGQGCPVCAHAKRAETCEKRYGCAMPILSEASRAKAKRTVQEKYGVGHITQAACVREKIKQTNLDRYGHENPMQNQKIVDKAKVTNIERYGVPCTMQNADVRAKHCASVKAHYGVENSMQAEEVRAKAKQTWLNKYGVENPRQSAEISEKIQETCMKKYNVPYAVMSDESKAKRVQTFIEHYGVDNPMKCDEVINKAKATNLQRYGFENPRQSPEIDRKIRETCERRFGVPYAAMSDEVKIRRIKSFLEKYGVDNPMKCREIVERAILTNLNRYGVENPMNCPEVQERICQTCIKRYGVRYAMQNPGIVQKNLDTKRENNTLNTSQSEERLYFLLCQKFGEFDICRQYSSEFYPYLCDFYVISRDLYIELNGSWTHGMHWYDEVKDRDLAAEFQDKAAKSEYYRNALTVLTYRDVEKRTAAKQNNLNYVVFWDDKLRDAELWFAMDCPDGQDWECEYSWIPKRDLQRSSQNPVFTGTPKNLTAIAKYYQFDIFYKHEIALWSENDCKKGLSLRIRLYHNRFKYLGKSPLELTNTEILRGFTISGIHKGYSAFDASLMQQIIDKYDIKSVYDPCAGWGERMLCCFNNNIKYQGVDINNDLKDGYLHMMADYNMQKQNIAFCDSADYKLDDNFDAVITCPPYGNIEIYTEYGSENLSDTDFLIWWQKVVEKCSQIKYFCFQINQKWKDRMLSVVENQGYKLIDEFKFSNNKSSHFNRRNGENTKKEFEVMLVLRKI